MPGCFAFGRERERNGKSKGGRGDSLHIAAFALGKKIYLLTVHLAVTWIVQRERKQESEGERERKGFFVAASTSTTKI